MTFGLIVQLIGAATIAVGLVKSFVALDNAGTKKDRASAANRHAVGSYHQR